jgi:hypothetical protein
MLTTRDILSPIGLSDGDTMLSKLDLKKQIDKGFIAAYEFTVRRLYIAA